MLNLNIRNGNYKKNYTVDADLDEFILKAKEAAANQGNLLVFTTTSNINVLVPFNYVVEVTEVETE